MPDLERTYTIPLRREFLKAPIYRRSKKAIKAVREFLIRHMKAKEVKILKELNEAILARGRKNPPPRVKIHALKKDDIVRVNLEGMPLEEKVEEKEIPKKEGKPEEKSKEEATKVEEQKKKEETEKRKILHKKQ